MPILLLIAWIVAEAWIITRLAERFGSLPVVVWLGLAAVAGVAVIRTEGLRVIGELRRATQRGELPAHALFEGLVVTMGGLLLILPGLISDIIGLSLLFAGLRRGLALRLHSGMAKARPDLKQPVTLEGEYTRRR
jgi:UPF0716 protein FxsA